MRPSTDLTRRLLSAACAAALLLGTGCHHHRPAKNGNDDTPTRDDGTSSLGPPPVQVVTTSTPAPVNKPLPPQADPTPPMVYADPAIVHQQLPEEPRYVQAYHGVSNPRLVVFVNRTITGELLPVNPGVTLTSNPVLGLPYLQPGQYDETAARSVDYQLIENLLSENLSADHKVTLVAPVAARQRLTDDEVRDIQAGRPQMLGELATKLNADVLVQVTARPSAQTSDGLIVRLVAEALDTHGGRALAFASVDVPPPLTQNRLNENVRFVSRKLMEGMSGSWEAMATPAVATTVQPAPPLPVPAPIVAPPSPTATAPTPTVVQVPAVSAPATRPAVAANPLDQLPPP